MNFFNLNHLGPCLIVLKTRDKQMVLSSLKGQLFLTQLTYKLANNSYKNREVQQSFNNNELTIHNIIDIDLSNVPSNLHLLYIRFKQSEFEQRLIQQGISVISSYNAPGLTCKVKIVDKYKVCVIVQTKRYKTFYVQRKFSSVPEAEDYIASNNMEVMLLATKGNISPYSS